MARGLPDWHERRRLANGRVVLIRPIDPADAEPLRAAFVLLEPEVVRQRFLASMHGLSAELAQRLTRVDGHDAFALVAAEPLPPGEALVGAVARVAVDPDGRRGEFAILVSRYVAHMGLGRHLMTRLVRWARRRRLHGLYGGVLADNLPMLELAASLGFRRVGTGEPGLVRVELELPAGRLRSASGDAPA